jgi:hypothetical protein
MEMMIPFSKSVNLGQLNAANYKLVFNALGGKMKARALSVSRAPVPAIDTLPYANVTNTTLADVFEGREDVTFNLTGTLNSTCMELDDQVEIVRQDDVYVILPVMKVKPNVVCAQVLVPFSKKVDLGRLIPGEYLLHVRAMNGASVNRVFTVMR